MNQLTRRPARALIATLVPLALAVTVAPAEAAQPRSERSAEGRVAVVEPTRRDMLRTVKDLVALSPRKTGTAKGRAAARYVARRLRAAGMDEVFMERSTSYSWKVRRDSLRIAGERVDQTPISFSFITGPTGTGRRSLGKRGLTAPVVDLGGLSTTEIATLDLTGKIALVDVKFLTPLAALAPLMEFIHDPFGEILDAQTMLTPNPYITSLAQTIDVLQLAGAAGMIGVLADYFDSNEYHNEYYRRSPMTIPGYWVTKDEGARVRELLRDDPRATMRLDIVRREVTALQPIGILHGRTDETIMVQSHHDSMGPGAVEDGTGTAEVIALAEHYGSLARSPRAEPREKTLMFTTFDTHFTGYQAHMHFVEKYVDDPDSPYDLVLNDTIEHVARKGQVAADGRLVLLDESEPRGFFENIAVDGKLMLAQSIVEHGMNATTILNGTVMTPVGVPTDASFTMVAGVPTVSLIAGPIYLYDTADTMAAVDKRSMVPVFRVNRDVIEWAERTPAALIGLPTGALG
ncbi:MAG: M28 family peptidase [Actinomycetota bacterium]|nr:M28 family peptidase [Actinomycetota bacterium]